MSDVLCLHLNTTAMPVRVHSGALSPGTRIGRYEVESFLGAGGMGEVYVARDTTLGRRIALKVLPSGCERDRIARFIREAQASSALNHPAIVSVHDAGSADGIQFLAMELIDGQPLSDWMRAHRNARRATELMSQVAEGLAAAHDAGIVHRDIKPANIMIGRDGHAKIVDFGVAKLTERASSPTETTDLQTAEGTRVGTVAYMSPEQIEGHDVDYRSDIFSFGTVLYELLAGKHPFAEKSQAGTIHNIAHHEPSLESIPGRQQRIVVRCLAKEPGERYQSMKDAAHDLRDELVESKVQPSRRYALWLLFIVTCALLAGALFLIARRRPPATPTRQLSMQPVTNSGNVVAAAISPDGRFVAYAEQQRGLSSLLVKQVATGATTPLIPPSRSVYPVIKISADGNYVFYSMWTPPVFAGDIYQIPILGGEPRKVVSQIDRLENYEFTLSPDGRQVAFFRLPSGNAELVIADIDEGGQRAILRRPGRSMIVPEWSPDGKSIAFIHVPKASQRLLEEISLPTGAVRVVQDLPWIRILAMAWLPDSSGMLVSAMGAYGPSPIWFVPRNGSAPVRITADISSYGFPTTMAPQSFAAIRGEGSPSISILSVMPDGAARVTTSGLGENFGVAGVRSRSTVSVIQRGGGIVLWIDSEHILYNGADNGAPTFFTISPRGGKPQQIIHGMRAWAPSLSSDRKRIAFISDRSGNQDVWVCDIDGAHPRQLTTAGDAMAPQFSADGAFVYYKTGKSGIARMPLRGGKPETVNVEVSQAGIKVSPDGRWLLAGLPHDDRQQVGIYALPAGGSPRVFDVPGASAPGFPAMRFHPSSRAFGFVHWSDDGIPNIWLQNIDGGPPRQITHFDRGDIYAFDWSPDGKWLAVSYGEPKTDVVIVRDFR
jgi:Tol biopolymer transport system component/predicted Ser/Thr protein kinase